MNIIHINLLTIWNSACPIIAYTKSNIQKLQEKYGRKYSYDIYKDVEADVNMELHEKPFSILMRLEKNKQRNTDHNHTKYRNHEQER